MSIQRKKKLCNSCNKLCFLWSHGKCQACANKVKNKPRIASKQYIKPISNKRKERLEKYYLLRDLYFKDNPICEFPGCSSREITLHHKRGRIGENLFKDFCSLCIQHHEYCESHPKEAQEMSLSYSRLN